MSMFQEATSAELIRSSQKDEFLIQTIRSQLLDILSEIFGPYSARYEHEIDLIAKLLYLIPTSLFVASTLGEEYCSIQSISPGYPYKLNKPSILRRLLLLIVCCCLPYLYNKLRKTGRNIYIKNEYSNLKKNLYKIYNNILLITRKSDKFIEYLLKFHLCYFYFNSKFYSFSKYLVNISYIYVGSKQNNNIRNVSYTALGRLLIIQFIITFIIVSYKYIQIIYKNRKYIKSQLSPKILLKKLNFHLLFNYNDNDDKDKPIDDDKKSNLDNKDDNDNGSNDGDDDNDDSEKENNDDDELIDDADKNDSEKLKEMGLRYENDDDLDVDISSIPECVLCLSNRRYATVTECGHIFCWNCISEWCTTKAQCPLCKSHISHQKLVRLANFR